MILSQFSLTLGPKSTFVSCGWGVASFGFPCVPFVTSTETGSEKLFCDIIIVPVLNIWALYVVSVEIATW